MAKKQERAIAQIAHGKRILAFQKGKRGMDAKIARAVARSMIEKGRAAFVRFALSVNDKTPDCEQGEDCDPAENPAHHIEIRIERWVLRAVNAALEELADARPIAETLIYGGKGTPVERELRAAYEALRDVR